MNNLERLKNERKKELLSVLESKKKSLQQHFDEGANKAIDVGKGMIVLGASILLLYTIIDRYLEAKFRSKSGSTSETSTKSSTNKLIYPLLSMALQHGANALFNTGQKRLVDYLKKKLKNEHLSGNISKK